MSFEPNEDIAVAHSIAAAVLFICMAAATSGIAGAKCQIQQNKDKMETIEVCLEQYTPADCEDLFNTNTQE